YVNTGLALVLNNTYKFEVTVDPAGKSWDGTVTNLATFETHTSTNLGWRIDTTLETGNPDAILSGLMQFCGRGNDSNDKRIFAVDSIQVHQEQSFTIGGMSQVVARFNDGETEEAVDGFVGMAGNGWNSAWSTRNDRATLAAAVSSANELKSGGGNCLEMTVTVGNTFTYGYGAGGVTRDYARVNETGIDWTQDHTIQFTVRIDEDMDAFSTSFTDVNDKYQIFDQAYARGGISGDTIWGAFANGDALGSSYWTFLDGSDVRTTGIALTQYGVYDFTIDINAAERTYDVTLVSGLDSFTAEDLDWRNPGIDYVGGFLNFMARGNETGEVRAWSIDDIVITAASSIPTDIPGDANNDGRVDADDAKALADNWGKSGDAAWADGDFNGDLKVDAKDAAILAANWGYVWSPAAPAAEGSIAGVPEPGAAALLLTMAAGLALGFDRRW
ncbi:MAG: hypothetical protein GX621_17250, partial [Pirellulaceae bacterium]|nr:hypothetical protein [Pirellulaceae bacterium]